MHTHNILHLNVSKYHILKKLDHILFYIEYFSELLKKIKITFSKMLPKDSLILHFTCQTDGKDINL